MSQRVNIQFSIDLEELPAEVARLFKQSAAHTRSALEAYTSSDYSDTPLSITSLNQIDEIRLCLTKADLVLDDLQKIIAGYLRMQTEPSEAATPVERPPMPEMPRSPFDVEAPTTAAPPRNPFAGAAPEFEGQNLSIEELQKKVQRAVEIVNNEQLAKGTGEGV